MNEELYERGLVALAKLEGHINYLAAECDALRKEAERAVALLNKYEARVEVLVSERDAARKDAERYRWMRERGLTWNGDETDMWLVDAIADEAIDAAMAQAKP